MESAGLFSAPALIAVTWVLVEQRWQDGPAEHEVGETVGIDSTEALSVPLRTQEVVGGVCCLVDACKEGCPDKRDRVDGGLKGKREFQLRRERRWIVIINDVEIGNDPKNALLLLELELCDCDLVL